MKTMKILNMIRKQFPLITGKIGPVVNIFTLCSYCMSRQSCAYVKMVSSSEDMT